MSLFSGSDSSGDEMFALNYYQNNQANKNIQNIDNVFSQFTPSWYQGRAKAFEQSALPNLSRQVRGENEAISYNLANRGLSNSSAGKRLFEDLGDETTKQQQNIANQGQQYANSLKQNIESSRLSLYSLGGTPGQGTASSAALSAASGFQAPNWFAPVANYLSDFNNQLSTRLALSSLGTTQSNSSPTITPYVASPSGGSVGGGGGAAAYSTGPSMNF